MNSHTTETKERLSLSRGKAIIQELLRSTINSQYRFKIGQEAINTLHQYWIKMVARQRCSIIQKSLASSKAINFTMSTHTTS